MAAVAWAAPFPSSPPSASRARLSPPKRTRAPIHLSPSLRSLPPPPLSRRWKLFATVDRPPEGGEAPMLAPLEEASAAVMVTDHDRVRKAAFAWIIRGDLLADKHHEDGFTKGASSESTKNEDIIFSNAFSVLKFSILTGLLIFQGSQEAIASIEVAGMQPTTWDLGDISTGFTSAFLLIFFSELGDKTFFIAPPFL